MFAHAALRADRRWEAFCFGTRLTRVTRALAATRPNEALDRAAEEVVDWNGGTRIGECLKELLDEYGHRGLVRGAVVVLCSDGLGSEIPDLLGEQMARLSRLAHRVIWLNPLKGDPTYEPLARGMHAALPFVDVFAGRAQPREPRGARDRAGAARRKDPNGLGRPLERLRECALREHRRQVCAVVAPDA